MKHSPQVPSLEVFMLGLADFEDIQQLQPPARLRARGTRRSLTPAL